MARTAERRGGSLASIFVSTRLAVGPSDRSAFAVPEAPTAWHVEKASRVTWGYYFD